VTTSDEAFVTPTFRDRMRQFCPPWLRTGWAEKYLYSFGLVCDAFGDALTAGVKFRYPGYYAPDSLAVIGRERRISRGLSEPDATYAERLTPWLEGHRHRGGPYAMLAMIFAYYAPNNFPIALIYRNGRRFDMDAAGVITRSDSSFSPDSRPEQWARWWLFYYTPIFASPTPEEVAELRLIPNEWNAAHCQGKLVVLPPGAELWNFPTGDVWDDIGKLWDIPGAVTIDIH
jgi:hypothetical protein